MRQYLSFSDLSHFSIMPSMSFHEGQIKEFPSFLRLSDISLSVCLFLLLCLHFDGHLGFFCVLATGNNAAMNMGYRYLFEIVILFLSDRYSKVEFLDHIVALNFFGESPYFFFIMTVNLQSHQQCTEFPFCPHPP